MKLTTVDYRRTLPLRDQAIGLAVFGSALRITNSLHPGFHGPLGQSAVERVFGTQGCVLPAFRPGEPATRVDWPGTIVPAARLTGAGPVVRISGTQRRALPTPSASWPGGRTMVITYRWSSTIAFRPRI
jgi:hypothetical protein